MSLYFQRLLVASGVARPTSPGAAMTKPASTVMPAIEEISEETIAPAPSPAPVLPSPVTPVSPPHIVGEAPPRFAAEPGTVEIGHAPDVVEAVANVDVEKPFTAWSSKTVARQPEPPAKPAPAPEQKPAAASAPASLPGQISREELIQHVFRWVGQNPQEVVPPALIAASPAPGESKAPATAPAAALSQPAAVPASSVLSEPVRRSPWPVAEPAQASRPAAPAPTETSVEISIGTLQIQVEAPPAQKNARRPHVPRPVRGLPAATPPPAIDINRLRRGFYL